VLLLFFGLLLRSSLDPACSSIRADHDRRMSQSEALLAGLSSLSIRDRCDFYRERAALFADKVRPGPGLHQPRPRSGREQGSDGSPPLRRSRAGLLAL